MSQNFVARVLPAVAIAVMLTCVQAQAQTVTTQTINDPPSEATMRQALSPFRTILRSSAAPAPAPARAKAAASATVQRARDVATTSPMPPPASKADTPAGASTSSAALANAAPAAIELPVAPPTPAGLAAATAQEEKPFVRPAIPVALRAPLVALRQDPPELSATLLRKGGRAIVKVAFNVNPDGTTSDVHVVSSNQALFNTAAIGAVSKWRFLPVEANRPAEVDLVFDPE